MSKWSWIVYLVSSHKWYMKHFRKYSSKIYEFSWTQDTLWSLIWSEVWITATSEVCSMAESSLSNFVEQLVRTYRYFQQNNLPSLPSWTELKSVVNEPCFFCAFVQFRSASGRSTTYDQGLKTFHWRYSQDMRHVLPSLLLMCYLTHYIFSSNDCRNNFMF